MKKDLIKWKARILPQGDMKEHVQGINHVPQRTKINFND